MARTLILRPRNPYSTVPRAAVRAWNGTLAWWGIGIGISASLLLSNTPIFKNDVLIKIPIIGSYWEDSTHPEDKWV